MNQKEIVDAIENALKSEGFGDPETRHDIAFHMTDWLANLEEWYTY